MEQPAHRRDVHSKVLSLQIHRHAAVPVASFAARPQAGMTALLMHGTCMHIEQPDHMTSWTYGAICSLGYLPCRFCSYCTLWYWRLKPLNVWQSIKGVKLSDIADNQQLFVDVYGAWPRLARGHGPWSSLPVQLFVELDHGGMLHGLKERLV